MKSARVKLFDELATVFKKHGFRLYMVGGTSRDFLLGEVLKDFDFATDATPLEMKNFLPTANYRFAAFGTVLVLHAGEKTQITTLRTEEGYLDYRHPHNVKFVKEIGKDYARRDFTINGLYIDEDYSVFDFGSGLVDLERRLLKTIGDPVIRFNEDPLRMIRALRFAVKFNLSFDQELEKALVLCAPLVIKLNPEKIKEERRKVSKLNIGQFDLLYTKYNF